MEDAELWRGAPAIERFLSELTAPYCLLLGAGVSLPAPSGMPLVQAIQEEIVATLTLLTERERREIRSLFSAEGRLMHFDFVRFEHAIEAIQRSADPNLSTIAPLFSGGEPNSYHYQAAQLAEAGNVVLTTNFDCLIEEAASRRGIAPTVAVSEDEYRRLLDEQAMSPLILKLHGSMKHGPVAAFQDETITMSGFWTGLDDNPSKWKVVEQLVSRRDILVAGYSGWDDLDVLPKISNGAKKLLWISHTGDPEPLLWSAASGAPPDELEERWGPKLFYYFCRMFGDALAKPKRSASQVLVLSAQTEHAFGRLGTRSVHAGPAPLTTGGVEESRAARVREFGRGLRRKLSESAERSLHLTALLAFAAREHGLAIRHGTAALERCASEKPAPAARLHDLLARAWRDQDVYSRAIPHALAALKHYERAAAELTSADRESVLELRAFVEQITTPSAARPAYSSPHGTSSSAMITHAECALFAGRLGDAHFRLRKLRPNAGLGRDWLYLMSIVRLMDTRAEDYVDLDEDVTFHLIVAGRLNELVNDKHRFGYALLALGIFYGATGCDDWSLDEADTAQRLFEALNNDLGVGLSLLLQSCVLWESGRMKESARLRTDGDERLQRWLAQFSITDREPLHCYGCDATRQFRGWRCTTCGVAVPSGEEWCERKLNTFLTLLNRIGPARPKGRRKFFAVPVDYRVTDHTEMITQLGNQTREWLESSPAIVFEEAWVRGAQALRAGELHEADAAFAAAIAAVDNAPEGSERPDDVAVAGVQMNWAMTLLALERPGEAKDLLLTGIETMSELVSASDADFLHRLLAKMYANLAVIHRSDGDSASAIECLEHAIAILDELEPPDSEPDRDQVASATYNLAVVLMEARQWQRAHGAIERSIRVRQELAVDGAPDTHDALDRATKLRDSIRQALRA